MMKGNLVIDFLLFFIMKNEKFTKLFSIANESAIIIPAYAKVQKWNTLKWISFGVDNYFPQQIAFLNRTSPVHGGILNSKCNYCTGTSLLYADKRFDLMNNLRENLQDIAFNYFKSWFGFGNCYLHVITNKKKQFLSIFILDYTMCRLGSGDFDGSILIHPDFKNIQNEPPISIPIFPNFKEAENGYLETVYMVNNMVDGFKPYGLADWFVGMDSAETNKAVNNGNKNKAMTGDWTDTFVSAQFDGIEEAEKFEAAFKAKKAGNENAGGIHFISQGVGASPTTVTNAGAVKDGFFENLHNTTVDNLIMAHGWFPALCSSSKNTGFDTNVILNEYMIAKNTVIEKNQKSFLSIIFEIYKYIFNKDISDEISFINKPPVIDKRGYRLWEYRKEIGTYIEGDEKLPEMQIIMT